MTQFSTQDFYNRDPKLIGNDMDLVEGEDIEVNNGDIKLITGVESIYKSLRRRLYTSKLGFERLLKTTEGLIIVNPEYGNDAFSYLSSLNNDINKDYVLNEIDRIFNDEPRIKLLSATLQESSNNSIQIEVRYLILSNEKLATLVI